jgi:perosamine synthetase
MIPVNEPVLSQNAKTYVNDCLNTGWISSAGSYIKTFEENFAAYLGVKHATTTTNGTTALHLALAALNVGPADEIIVPDLTIISCALAVIYTGATPVFVDVETNTGTLDPEKIENAITQKTKAIMVVHLYGHPADMDPILGIAKKYNLKVIEDAAEAHGAQYKGRMVGSLGDVACYSFYANKLIATGEGGMVVTNDTVLYEHAKLLKDLAHSPKRRFLHEEIGFNYRMTNLQAAIGCGELEQIETYIEKKRWMAHQYKKRLSCLPWLELPGEASWAKSVYWMYAVKVTKDSPLTKEHIRMRLKELGVDTRDFFVPLSKQPVFKKTHANKNNPVALDLSNRGFYLPSGLAITEEQIDQVAQAMKNALR